MRLPLLSIIREKIKKFLLKKTESKWPHRNSRISAGNVYIFIVMLAWAMGMKEIAQPAT